MPILNQVSHIAFIIASFLSILSGYQYLKYRTPMARWGALFLFGLAIELLSYSIQLMGAAFSSDGFWYFLETIDFYFLSVFWLLLISEIAGIAKRMNLRIILPVLCIPAIILILMLSSTLSQGSNGPGAEMADSITSLPRFVGPFGVVLTSFFCINGLISTLFLTYLSLKSDANSKKLVFPMLIGTVFLVLICALEQAGVNPFRPVSSIQIGLAAGSLMFFFVTVIWHFGGILPISRESVFEELPEGVLILDYFNSVVDVNDAAQKIIGLGKKSAIHRQLSSIWPLGAQLIADHPFETQIEKECELSIEGQDMVFDINISQFLGLNNDPTGRLIVLRNVTSRDRMEKALSQRAQEFQRTNAFLAALAGVTVSLQTTTDLSQINAILGGELKKLGLVCFIAQLDPDTNELVMSYLSAIPEILTKVEKILRGKINNFRLDKDQFSILYKILESKEISFKQYDPADLGNSLRMIPSDILGAAIRLIGLQPAMAALVLPLVVGDRKLGLMGVWGENFSETDIPPFQIFANQVAHVMERAILYEAEIRRSTELARSNALIIALSKVASVLGTTSNSGLVLDTLGKELNKVGLTCAVVSFDTAVETAFIKYLSLTPDLIGQIEKITGIQLKNFAIPKRFWPGEKIQKAQNPIWYPHVTEIITKMFPMVPEGIGKKVYPLVGFKQEDQLCILPLRIGDQVIGAMPIWGSQLKIDDNPILSVFASQVATIIQNVTDFENEVQRKDELARSNAMIIALSNVAARLDTTSKLTQVFESLGDELKQVHVNCMVGTLDDGKQNMKIEYLSMPIDLGSLAEKISALLPKEFIIPRRLWPTEKAVTERAPYWDPDMIGSTCKMFPFVPKAVFLQAFKLAGINPNDPVCYLPMASEEDVIGILAVWGPNLKNADIPGLSVFANQVATAIKNTRLFNQAQKEIVERTQTEARIQEALNEKEVLLREVHHRVKNNLQVISSMLNLQAAQISDMKTVDALKESQNRVRSMALIHEKLYQSNDLARIDFEGYLQNLVNSLAQTYRLKSEKVVVQVHSEKITLNIDTAIPCGLIVNELVSNSLKYAFPAESFGTIEVSCRRSQEGHCTLVVCDDGIGLPDGFKVAESPSLGLKLVTSLIRQIDGELKVDSKHGTCYEIKFMEL